LIPPFNVVVTQFPAAAGGFYEGSFTGQYLTNGVPPTHNISCSFRVRR
jgi:hypothetical protein